MPIDLKKLSVRAMSPLRLGLAGGGTDVSPYSDEYGGCVLNATVNLFTYANIEPRQDNQIVFQALDLNEQQTFSVDQEIPNSGSLALHKGVYNRIIRDFNEGKPLALTLTTHSDAPVGSGLGSSSAMVVAMLTAFSEWMKLPLGEYDLARLAYDIERIDLGMQGGKQDQYAATFGGFNFMEFSGDRVIVNPLRVKTETLAEIQYNLMLYYLGSSRLSSEIIATQMRHVQEKTEKPLAAMHKLKEQAVLQKEALLKGDLRSFGKLLGYGWNYKKAMSEQISNPAIETVYDRCMSMGALGVKLSGAGGGGFMMIYCDGYAKFRVAKGLDDLPGKIIPYQFVKGGATAWPMQKEK